MKALSKILNIFYPPTTTQQHKYPLVFLKIVIVYLFILNLISVSSASSDHQNSISENPLFGGLNSLASTTVNRKIGVLYESQSPDSVFQGELFKSVFIALRDLDLKDDLVPQFIDFSTVKLKEPSESTDEIVTQWLVENETKSVISLLPSKKLENFATIYEKIVTHTEKKLTIVTPRLVNTIVSNRRFQTLRILCLQMNKEALANGLLHRVQKVRVKHLIPILGELNEDGQKLIKVYSQVASEMNPPINLLTPIALKSNGNGDNSERNLGEIIGSLHEISLGNVGILLLANENEIQDSLDFIRKEKDSDKLRLFSHANLIEYEESIFQKQSKSTDSNKNRTSDHLISDHSSFGLYSLQFVGSTGWDNPKRRILLRELNDFTGGTPRVLSSVLAYDAATISVREINGNLAFPMMGLSGEISFDRNGYRRDGTYFGISSVSQYINSPTFALLQSSDWVLEDIISMIKTLDEDRILIKEYDVATSSLLNREELLNLSNITMTNGKCPKGDEEMEVLTHDPFNQAPYTFLFNKTNLPKYLLISNQNGFGLTFSCKRHGDLRPILRIACTPGVRLSDPVNCFRSEVILGRNKRASGSYYPGGIGENIQKNYYSPRRNYKYAKPRDYQVQSSHYYQPPPASQPMSYYGSPDSSTPNTLTTRLDVPIDEPSTTKSSAPPGSAAKLPDLRQVLKAAKPFVGSCLGSTTGCAVCVLVLGRLPLGTLPAACTGPCFVGTFGTCGSLLGRVFSETTIICTELFKQGYLDIDTFIADAEFGRKLLEHNPNTLKGYRILATPLVEQMKKSSHLTRIVSIFAVPWAHHMRYLTGHSNELNILGAIVHLIGEPLCQFVGFWNSGSGGIIVMMIYAFFPSISILFLIFRKGYFSSSSKDIKIDRRKKIIVIKKENLHQDDLQVRDDLKNRNLNAITTTTTTIVSCCRHRKENVIDNDHHSCNCIVSPIRHDNLRLLIPLVLPRFRRRPEVPPNRYELLSILSPISSSSGIWSFDSPSKSRASCKIFLKKCLI